MNKEDRLNLSKKMTSLKILNTLPRLRHSIYVAAFVILACGGIVVPTAGASTETIVSEVSVQPPDFSLMSRDVSAQSSNGSVPLFVSEPLDPGHEFIAIGLRLGWKDVTAPGFVAIEIRSLQVSDQQWTDWQEVSLLEDVPDAHRGDLTVATELLFVDASSQFQYRILSSSLNSSLSTITFTVIDSRYGSAPVSAASTSSKPNIVTRAGWGADESKMTWNPEYALPPSKIILHHTAGSQGGTNSAAVVRGIYHYHAVSLGWGDIGYNYLIDEHGTIFEGRSGGDGVIAGHTFGFNTGSIGIATLGNYETTALPSSSFQAVVGLSAYLSHRFDISVSGSSVFHGVKTPNIGGHRDYSSTACPGMHYFTKLDALRSAIQAHAASVVVSRIITAPGPGGGPHIRAFTHTGSVDSITNIFAYDQAFRGGVFLDVGDIDADGADEIIVGAGPGAGPHLRVFERDGEQRGIQFFPFHPDFRGGLTVASGDVDGDGKDEIGVCQASDGQAWCKVYRYNNKQEILAYWNVFGTAEVGARIAFGDIDNDGKDEVIIGAGPGGGPHVRVYDIGTKVVSGPNQGATLKPISFFAFHPHNRSGVDVAAGDVDGDGKAEIAVSQLEGDEAWIKVYRYNSAQTVLGNWRAYPAGVTSGAYISMGDVNGDGRDNILTGPGRGGGPQVRAFYADGTPLPLNFFAYNAAFRGGVRPVLGQF
jgi:hypothetical protein